MSTRSKYPSKKILIPAATLVTAAVVIALGISSVNTVMAVNGERSYPK